MIRKCQKNNIQAKKKKHHQFVTEKLLLKNMNKKRKNMNKQKESKKELCSLGFDKKNNYK